MTFIFENAALTKLTITEAVNIKAAICFVKQTLSPSRQRGTV